MAKRSTLKYYQALLACFSAIVCVPILDAGATRKIVPPSIPLCNTRSRLEEAAKDVPSSVRPETSPVRSCQSSDEVQTILQDTADKRGNGPYVGGRNDHYGYGRVNAFDVLWADCDVTDGVDILSVEEAAAAGWIPQWLSSPHGSLWERIDTQEPRNDDSLRPWRAYFAYPVRSGLTLIVPAP